MQIVKSMIQLDKNKKILRKFYKRVDKIKKLW